MRPPSLFLVRTHAPQPYGPDPVTVPGFLDLRDKLNERLAVRSEAPARLSLKERWRLLAERVSGYFKRQQETTTVLRLPAPTLTPEISLLYQQLEDPTTNIMVRAHVAMALLEMGKDPDIVSSSLQQGMLGALALGNCKYRQTYVNDLITLGADQTVVAQHDIGGLMIDVRDGRFARLAPLRLALRESSDTEMKEDSAALIDAQREGAVARLEALGLRPSEEQIADLVFELIRDGVHAEVIDNINYLIKAAQDRTHDHEAIQRSGSVRR